MLSCFNSPMRITQDFGNKLIKNGKEYYKQFGLEGHNGIDIIPAGKERGIYNFFSGKILKLKYSGAYGNRIVIWNKETQLSESHNHLDYFNKELEVGQYIESGTYLGEMGQSGKVFGAHDHVEFKETTANGYVINIDNGYKGGVDPLFYIG